MGNLKRMERKEPAAEPDFLRRVPPQNLDAEESVLGASLLDNTKLPEAAEILTAEDFYREAHRTLFRTMEELSDRNQPIDAITLIDALRAKGKLEDVGGPAYIAELAERVPTAANIAHYARIVRDKAQQRAIVRAAVEITAEAYEPQEDVAAFADDAARRMMEACDRTTPDEGPVLIREAAPKLLHTLEQASEKKGMLTGLSTGLLDLDRLTAGLHPGNLIVVAGRPSLGKTSLALNIAASAVLRDARTVLFFTLEMPREQLLLRLVCAEAGVSVAKARAGFVSQEEMRRLVQTCGVIDAAKLYVDDSSQLSPSALTARSRRLARQEKGLDLIVVDYLQFMRPSRTWDSREREIAEVSRSLKALAKDLLVPVIAVSQLNRQVEARADRRPCLADLRESGAIEQDADEVVFLWHPSARSGNPGPVKLLVEKQRNGPTGEVPVTWIPDQCRFADYAAEDTSAI